MKIKTALGLIGVSVFALTSVVLAAGHGGGGGGFGGGGFAGGGHFAGGGARPSFGGGRAGGFRYSFGARPMFGRPVMVRPQNRIANSTVRSAGFGGQHRSDARPTNRTTATSRAFAARAATRPTDSASNHVYARHDGNWHHDWDHRSGHFWKGHWWAWDGYGWIGLDAGFYPWDYFPYYAYDYYPYDYYPGYYANVEPYYHDDGVDTGIPAADPTVTAIQTDLTNMGYYSGPIDGLYGRDTRDAVARYQTAKHLAVTGTLTTETLQSLGVPSTTAS